MFDYTGTWIVARHYSRPILYYTILYYTRLAILLGYIVHHRIICASAYKTIIQIGYDMIVVQNVS